MSVDKGENGRRFVQVEVEVPGSPEVVWQAIATGPGISSWFVPTEVEERVGGAFSANFGPGMESVSTITQWNPPHNFVKDGDGMDPDAPPVATEWIVEAKSGDTCVVRVVHSWFANTDEWDGQWEAVEQGWKDFFNILRLARERFPGQRSAAFDAAGMSGMSEMEAWEALASPLGLEDAVKGQEVHSLEGNPTLSGKVEITGGDESKQAMLLLSEPAPGICHLMAMPMGDRIYLSIRMYLFGDAASGAVATAEPEWRAWFGDRFPMES
jgi:uncharacterized protein YndB with AHSA1/START domain